MVNAAECGVVDDALRAFDVRCETREAVHCGVGFAAGRGNPLDVQDDAAVWIGAARGDEDELDAPCGLAGAFEVEATIGFGAHGAQLAGGLVESCGAGLGAVEGSDDLAVRVQEPRRIGVRPRARSIRVEQAELSGLAARNHRVLCDESAEGLGVGEVAVAAVAVVVASHRLLRQPLGLIARVLLPHESTDEIPDDRMREFGFDPTCAAVHGEKRGVGQPHERGVVAWAATLGVVGECYLVGKVVDRRVAEDRLDPLERGDGGGGHVVSHASQSHPMIAAARSRLRTPSTRAASSIRPDRSNAVRPVQAATETGRTSGSAESPARRSVSWIA